jgi:hypothetical protein
MKLKIIIATEDSEVLDQMVASPLNGEVEHLTEATFSNLIREYLSHRFEIPEDE